MPRRNTLLGALSPAGREQLVAMGQEVELAIRQVVYEAHEPIAHVYFPFSGVISLVAPLEGGDVIEIATVGPEGMVGLPAFLGARSIRGRAFAQVPGRSLRIASRSFREYASGHLELQDLLHRYAQALFTQVAQSVVCMRRHNVEQRCARWMLMTHDRVEGDSFTLTQEFLGQMLGVRRASVSEVASRLQADGLIRYARATITIVDREGLEQRSCECYRVVQDEYRRLLGRRAATG